MFYIYKITNIINDKFYVGKTKGNVNKRFFRHIQDALSNRLHTHLANAIRKYGKDNFIIEIIDFANSEKELNQKEIFWIKKLDAVNKGYNQTLGGDGGNTYQYKSKEEMENIKEKIRKSKISTNNANARSVKCKNVITNEELFFDTINECRIYFKEKSNSFIISRCQYRTKFIYKNQWIFAYINNNYITDYSFEKSNHRKKRIKVLKISENKEYIFSSYKNAEKFFDLPNKFFSSHAYKYKDKEYWDKSDFRIFVLE